MIQHVLPSRVVQSYLFFLSTNNKQEGVPVAKKITHYLTAVIVRSQCSGQKVIKAYKGRLCLQSEIGHALSGKTMQARNAMAVPINLPKVKYMTCT